ncbi:unnamed protein product [Closterium sp. NIES-54]
MAGRKSIPTMSSGQMTKRISSCTHPEPSVPPPTKAMAKSTCTHPVPSSSIVPFGNHCGIHYRNRSHYHYRYRYRYRYRRRYHCPYCRHYRYRAAHPAHHSHRFWAANYLRLVSWSHFPALHPPLPPHPNPIHPAAAAAATAAAATAVALGGLVCQYRSSERQHLALVGDGALRHGGDDSAKVVQQAAQLLLLLRRALVYAAERFGKDGNGEGNDGILRQSML